MLKAATVNRVTKLSFFGNRVPVPLRPDNFPSEVGTRKMAQDVARFILQHTASISLPLNPESDRSLLSPLTWCLDLRVGGRSGEAPDTDLMLNLDVTPVLWRAIDKALKQAGINIRLHVIVDGAQHAGPYDVELTIQVDPANNPKRTTLWDIASTDKVPIEFHPNAAASEQLQLDIKGDCIRERRESRYFFIGFRPKFGRGQFVGPPTLKRSRLETWKSEGASHDDFYRLVTSSDDGFKLVVV